MPAQPHYLAEHGARLIANGYAVVPIAPGLKHPGFDGWQDTHATVAQLETWEKRYPHYGVGILTATTPAIDLDVRDQAMARALERFCQAHFGFAPVRVGDAPKRLLLYRCDEPFAKVNSPRYRDAQGVNHKVEVLGRGQQFVAYHIHPDTHKPYVWTSGSPLNEAVKELPLLDRIMALAVVAEFERLAAQAGWTRLRGTSPAVAASAQRQMETDDNWFAADTARVEDVSDDDLQAQLLTVAGAEDYETWIQIGMALYHQFEGGDRGLELWHDWSQGADNYDADALDAKWSTFDISDKGRAPVTARLILKLAQESREEAAEEDIARFAHQIAEAATSHRLQKVCQAIRGSELLKPSRDTLALAVRERWKALNAGTILPLSTVREMVRYQAKVSHKTPKWCRHWIYASSTDSFVHLKTGAEASHRGFNSMHERHMLSRQEVLNGKSKPANQATDVALNVVQIPLVHGTRYMPGAAELFSIDGIDYANTYTENGVPEVPEQYSEGDLAAIKRVEAHVAHLLCNPIEQAVFLDYLAYNVQFPGKKIRWAILLQGCENDGKSFFADMMSAVMGTNNVRSLNAKSIEGSFNGWAEGQCMAFVEEVKLQGHNRFDVLNTIKPSITNDLVDVHRKGRDPYTTLNTTNYILFTNFRNALPLALNDTRYYVLFSRWQLVSELNKFKQNLPDYYDSLYDSMREHVPALRKWFLERAFSANFNPRNRAPDSDARRYMVDMARPEELKALEEAMADNALLDLSYDLLNTTTMADALIGNDVTMPQTRALSHMLTEAGFTFLGRFRLEGREGPNDRFWSQRPELFMRDGKVQIDLIHAYLKREKAIADL